MELIESLFTAFIDIVLHVIGNSGYLCYFIMSAFIFALVVVMVYAFIRGFSDV